ncbi:hypothetical protein NESM_000041200 [Novymonas esmeraldas]|uniref:Uncharacterized protein n=1 Tax=Novymonas esmeraldas TaxID=1808958 RepID=A0AAW0EZV9_9TRYP
MSASLSSRGLVHHQPPPPPGPHLSHVDPLANSPHLADSTNSTNAAVVRHGVADAVPGEEVWRRGGESGDTEASSMLFEGDDDSDGEEGAAADTSSEAASVMFEEEDATTSRRLGSPHGAELISATLGAGDAVQSSPVQSSPSDTDARVCSRPAQTTEPRRHSRTSRKLVYSVAGTILSPPAALDNAAAAGSGTTAAVPRVGPPPPPTPPRAPSPDESDAPPPALASGAAHAHRTALPPSRSPPPRPGGDACEEPGRGALVSAGRVLSPSATLDLADAAMESAMLEMEARLRLRRHSVGRHGVDAAELQSDGGVASHGGTPPSHDTDAGAAGAEGEVEEEEEDGRDSVASERRPHPIDRAPSSAHGAREADLVRSSREDDWLECPPPHHAAASAANGLYSDGVMESREEKDTMSAGYTFFSTQLPPPVDRRAHIYELAKVLRHDPSHAASPGPADGLITSPSALAQLPRGVTDAVATAPLSVRCAAGDTSLSVGDAPLASADLVSFSSQHTPVPPRHGGLLAPHPADATTTDLQVCYSWGSGDFASGPARSLRRASPPPLGSSGEAESSTAEGISTAVAAAAALTINTSTTPSRTPSTSRRQRPPPRMLCPPTPSPSPSPSRAALAVEATPAGAAAGGVGGDERDADVTVQSAVPDDATYLEPLLGPAAEPVLCTASATVEVAELAPTAATTAVASSAITSPLRSTAELSEAAPAEPALPAMAPTESAVASPEAEGEEAALVEPRVAVDTSVSVGDAEGPPPLASRCTSGTPSRPQLWRSSRPSSASVRRAESAPRDTRAAPPSPGGRRCGRAALRASSAQRPRLETPHTVTEGSSPVLSLGAALFPRRGHGGDGVVVASASVIHVLGEAAEADSTTDNLDEVTSSGSSGGLGVSNVLSARQSTRSGDERLAPLTPQSSPAASPSPVRPSTVGGCGEGAPLFYEAWPPCVASRSGSGDEDEEDEARLCYDDGTSSRVVSAAAATAARPTWQSETLDGLYEGDGDDDDTDGEARADATCVEEALCRAEATSAVLRLELAAATEGAAAAVERARVRELECAELHRLVDHLQAELAAARESAEAAAVTATRVGVETQTDGDVATVPTSLPDCSEAPGAVPPRTREEDAVQGAESVWQRRHDAVAQELAILKGCMAEQLAVLDRLGVRPPFSEAVVSAAERRLRHVRVVHAPGTDARVSRSDVVAPGTPHSPRSAGTPTSPAARMQASDGNSIASLLRQRKQNGSAQQPVPSEAVVAGETKSDAAASLHAPRVKRNGDHDSRRGGAATGAKENVYAA